MFIEIFLYTSQKKIYIYTTGFCKATVICRFTKNSTKITVVLQTLHYDDILN